MRNLIRIVALTIFISCKVQGQGDSVCFNKKTYVKIKNQNEEQEFFINDTIQINSSFVQYKSKGRGCEYFLFYDTLGHLLAEEKLTYKVRHLNKYKNLVADIHKYKYLVNSIYGTALKKKRYNYVFSQPYEK